MEEGALLSIYDPKVQENQIKKDINFGESQNEIKKLAKANSIEIAIKDSAIIILTEWEEFKNIDWEFFIKNMKKPSWIFDTRSIVNKKAKNGF